MSDVLNFDSLAGLVDEELLNYTDEALSGLNRGRLIQGDPKFESNKDFKETPYYKGGIGLSIDGLSEEVINKSTVMQLDSGEYAVFEKLSVVALASSRIRRFFGEIDGQDKLICGTNQDGQSAVGWSGISCKACKYHRKNYEGKKGDACNGSIPVLCYIPELDHSAVLEFRGASYMPATDWLKQVSLLSKRFAERPEMSKLKVARVNSYFFKTTLKASEFFKGEDSNTFQKLLFEEATAPYKWEHWLNSAETIQKSKEVLSSMEDAWKRLYVDAGQSLFPTQQIESGALAVAALPAAPQVEKVHVEAPTQEAPAKEAQVVQAESPQATTVELEDDDAPIMTF